MTVQTSAATGRWVAPPRARVPKTSTLVALDLRQRIVRGELHAGDFLPQESQLMETFGVSRPTLREALRLLESEGLLEVRRGSRTGPQVQVPGPEAVVRPAGLLLELAGATVGDVVSARLVLEPGAVRMIAERADRTSVAAALEARLAALPPAAEPEVFVRASAAWRLELVRLSGNAALLLVAQVLNDITERHIEGLMRIALHEIARREHDAVVATYRELVELVRRGEGAAAEALWRTHMKALSDALVGGLEGIRIADAMTQEFGAR